MWHKGPSTTRYFFLFLKSDPSHSATCSIFWSWLLCSVPPTYSCFEVSPEEDSLIPLPRSWPLASFHVVCLLPCKLGWAAGKVNSLQGGNSTLGGRRGLGSPFGCHLFLDLSGPLCLQAASCPGSIF